MNELSLYSEIEHAIIVATKIDEIKEIRKKLSAIAKYRRDNYPDHFKAIALEIKAALKHIEIYDGLENKRPPSIHAGNDRCQQINWQDAGFFHREEPKRLRKIRKSIDEENWREYLEGRRLGNLLPSYESLFNLAKEIFIPVEDDNPNQELPPSIELIHSDIKDVELKENSIDLILTDPPYAGKDIEVWILLSEFAYKYLKNNGFMIAYSGQIHLNEVMKRLDIHLNYFWTFALKHSGNNQLINPRNLFCAWKPILIYQKGIKLTNLKCEDFIVGSGREKEDHDWQQGEDELETLIESFSNKGDLICDPFLGSGTTLSKAYKMGRRCLGIEKNKETLENAKSRLSQ